MAKFPERVFSGVQPTGNLHLGNYLGAIKRFVEMQATHPCIYCVVDLHAMTMPHDPEQLARTTREVTAAFLACGIDPEANIVFNQSRVAEHAELAWVLDCVARLGWLNRMTQFKEKAGKDRENASVGLYNYPVLMAADILVYRATHVPGRRRPEAASRTRPRHRAEIQQRFRRIDRRPRPRRRFFPLPEPLIQGPATRVMSLRDGAKKMSKSDPSEYSLDRADRRRRHDRAEDPPRQDRPGAAAERGRGAAGRPEADNLVGIFAGLNDETKAEVLQALRRRAVLGLQDARWPNSRSRSSRRSAPKCCVSRRPGLCRRGAGGRAPRGRARSPRPVMDAVKDILGLLR